IEPEPLGPLRRVEQPRPRHVRPVGEREPVMGKGQPDPHGEQSYATHPSRLGTGVGLLAPLPWERCEEAMSATDRWTPAMENGANGGSMYPLLRRTQLSRFLDDAQIKELEKLCRG